MKNEAPAVQSESRGSHWVAWIVEAGQDAPAGAALMVGTTREEAEARVREWWAAQRR